MPDARCAMLKKNATTLLGNTAAGNSSRAEPQGLCAALDIGPVAM
jgi:hypothetical protein